MLKFNGTEIKTKQDLLDRFDLKDALEQNEEFLLFVSRHLPSCLYPNNSLYDHCRKILSRIMISESEKNEIKSYITEAIDFWSFPKPKDKRGKLSDTSSFPIPEDKWGELKDNTEREKKIKVAEGIGCLDGIFGFFKATEQTNDMWNVDFARTVATFLIVQEIAKESFSTSNSIIQEKFFLGLKKSQAECIKKLEYLLLDGIVRSADNIEASKVTAEPSAPTADINTYEKKAESVSLLPENGSVLSCTAHRNELSIPYNPEYRLQNNERIRTLRWEVENGMNVILVESDGSKKTLPNGDVYVNAVGKVVVSVLSIPKTDQYNLTGTSSAVLLENENGTVTGCVYILNGNICYQDWGVDELDESWYFKKPFVEVAIDKNGVLALLNEKGVVFSFSDTYNGKNSVVSLKRMFNEVKLRSV